MHPGFPPSPDHPPEALPTERGAVQQVLAIPAKRLLPTLDPEQMGNDMEVALATVEGDEGEKAQVIKSYVEVGRRFNRLAVTAPLSPQAEAVLAPVRESLGSEFIGLLEGHLEALMGRLNEMRFRIERQGTAYVLDPNERDGFRNEQFINDVEWLLRHLLNGFDELAKKKEGPRGKKLVRNLYGISPVFRTIVPYNYKDVCSLALGVFQNYEAETGEQSEGFNNMIDQLKLVLAERGIKMPTTDFYTSMENKIEGERKKGQALVEHLLTSILLEDLKTTSEDPETSAENLEKKLIVLIKLLIHGNRDGLAAQALSVIRPLGSVERLPEDDERATKEIDTLDPPLRSDNTLLTRLNQVLRTAVVAKQLKAYLGLQQ